MSPRWIAVLGAALYTAVLKWAYPLVGPPIYGPTFLYEPLPAHLELMSWVLALLPAYWMPVRLFRPSVACYWLLYLLVIVPTTFIPMQTMDGRSEEVFLFVVAIWACFLALGALYTLPLPKFPRPHVNRHLYFLGLGALALVLVAAIAAGTGLKLDLDLTTVYQRRAEAREVAGARSANLYLASTLGNALAPMLFAFGLAYKRWGLIVISLVGLAAVFSLSGLKSVFFTPILMLGVWLLLRGVPRASSAVLGFGAAGLGLVSGLLWTLQGNLVLALLFLHRLCFTPATLSSYYWEFFSANPKVMLSDSILAPFFEREYDKNVGPLIGEVYYQSDVMNATTGVWAQGFAHFGYPGIVVVTLAVALIFWLYDGLARDRGKAVATMMMALLGVFWSNVAFHTSLISNGILFTLVCLWLMPPDPKRHEEPPLAA